MIVTDLYWSLIDQYLHTFVFKKNTKFTHFKGFEYMYIKKIQICEKCKHFSSCFENVSKTNTKSTIPSLFQDALTIDYMVMHGICLKKINISVNFETSIDNLNTWCYTINVLNGLLDVKCKTSWDWFLKGFFLNASLNPS